jgi:hypothetical protein
LYFFSRLVSCAFWQALSDSAALTAGGRGDARFSASMVRLVLLLTAQARAAFVVALEILGLSTAPEFLSAPGAQTISSRVVLPEPVRLLM